MSVVSIIEKSTGKQVLRVVLFDGSTCNLNNDINHFARPQYEYLNRIDENCIKLVDYFDEDETDAAYVLFVDAATKKPLWWTLMMPGTLIMPYRVVEGKLLFDESRTYTPDELMAKYSSELYEIDWEEEII